MIASRHLLILGAFGAGAVLTALGLWRALWPAPPGGCSDVQREPSASGAAGDMGRRAFGLALLALGVVALVLRFEGLERRGMTHVEVYVPGIALPDSISEPPPRVDAARLVSWHFHDEPHPQGYYFFMWGWTRTFGTGLTSIRLPSVLLGAGCVILAGFLAGSLFGGATGLVAAALIAFSGFQVYWSQHARMYVMSCFLGLLSTASLLALMRSAARSPRREFAYVAFTWLTLFTQLFGWALLAGQVVAVMRYARTATRRLPRLLELQGMVAMLGAPLLAHAVYRSRPTEFLETPQLGFLRDYLNFGFLFEPDGFSDPARAAPTLLALSVSVLAAVCLVAAAVAGPAMPAPRSSPEARGPSTLTLVALGTSLAVLGLASVAWQRQAAMAVTAVFPFLMLGLLALGHAVWPSTAGLQAKLDRQPQLPEAVGFLLLLAIVPMALLMAAHQVKPVVTSRGAILFVPYLLMVFASGCVVIWRRSVVPGLALAAALVAVHVQSVRYYRQIPAPNDYRTVADVMAREFQPGDLVFVPPRSWITTPLFYHLQADAGRLVATNYGEALRDHSDARVWVPLFSDQTMSPEMEAALAGRTPVKVVTAFRTRASLYGSAPNP